MQSTVGDDLEITPYSCVTLVNTEIHPLSPPTAEDTPIPSVSLSTPPNLVVTKPTEGDDQPPALPPPRGRGLATGNRWEMHYAELQLEGGLGWGKFGTVVRGTLRKDSDTHRCVHPVARLEMGQGGSEHQWRVAVKFMAGGSMLEEVSSVHCVVRETFLWLVTVTSSDYCGEFNCTVITSCTTHFLTLPSILPDSRTEKDMQDFYNEVAIMKRVSRGGNPHVITMVGYIPWEYPPAIVMEFAPLSTLLKFLMKVKDDVSVVHITQVLVVCSIQPHHGKV